MQHESYSAHVVAIKTFPPQYVHIWKFVQWIIFPIIIFANYSKNNSVKMSSSTGCQLTPSWLISFAQVSGDLLRINRATEQDAGTYTCLASNTQGRARATVVVEIEREYTSRTFPSIGPGTAYYFSCLSHDTTYFGMSARTLESTLWRGSNIRVKVIGGTRTTLSGAYYWNTAPILWLLLAFEFRNPESAITIAWLIAKQ